MRHLPPNCDIEMLDEDSFRLIFHNEVGGIDPYVSEEYHIEPGEVPAEAARKVCEKFGWLDNPPLGGPAPMSKSAAIRHARTVVGELRPSGDGWVYTVFDPKTNTSREIGPLQRDLARTFRAQALVDAAHAARHKSGFVTYSGGDWTKYVR